MNFIKNIHISDYQYLYYLMLSFVGKDKQSSKSKEESDEQCGNSKQVSDELIF